MKFTHSFRTRKLPKMVPKSGSKNQSVAVRCNDALAIAVHRFLYRKKVNIRLQLNIALQCLGPLGCVSCPTMLGPGPHQLDAVVRCCR